MDDNYILIENGSSMSDVPSPTDSSPPAPPGANTPIAQACANSPEQDPNVYFGVEHWNTSHNGSYPGTGSSTSVLVSKDQRKSADKMRGKLGEEVRQSKQAICRSLQERKEPLVFDNVKPTFECTLPYAAKPPAPVSQAPPPPPPPPVSLELSRLPSRGIYLTHCSRYHRFLVECHPGWVPMGLFLHPHHLLL